MLSFLEPYWLMTGPVLATAVGLGFLIFIHELGHFVVAKRAGVKVEVFSLGVCHFIFSWTWKGTIYALSWLPLGGYVRMAGQQDLAPPPDRKLEPHEYGSKRPLVRLAIISAGVIMNFIAGWMCFSASYAVGLDIEVPVVGDLDRASLEGTMAIEAGLKPGDRILKVNGDPVYTYRGLVMRVARERPSTEAQPHLIDLTVKPATEDRAAQTRTVQVRTEEGPDRGLSSIEHLLGNTITELPLKLGFKTERQLIVDGRAKVLNRFPAWAALFRPGDRFEKVNGQPCKSRSDLDKILANCNGRDVDVEVSDPDGKTKRVSVPTSKHYEVGIRFCMFRKNMTASQVIPGSPAEGAGIQMGDEIRLGHEAQPCTPREFIGKLQASGESGLMLDIRRPDGGTRKVMLQPRSTWFLDPGRAGPKGFIGPYGMSLVVTDVVRGSVAERKGLRPGAVILELSSDVRRQEPVTLWWARGGRLFGPHRLPLLAAGPELHWEIAKQYEHLRMNPGEAMLAGWVESRETLMGTTVLIRKMLSGGASASNVMGPLGIVGVAYRSAQEGLGHMLWLLGLIGVSLAFFNLLPIPVLDGGHMVFLVYELITRRPPPPRLIEIAQYAGLLIILGLFVFVFYNDIHRMIVSK